MVAVDLDTKYVTSYHDKITTEDPPP